jgi:site-specific recombinase XerD
MQIGVYDNFTITIKSNATRTVYRNNLNLFMQFLGITDCNQLLKINAEDAIKQYIIYLKEKVSSATLHIRIAAIYHFYTINDVILNKTKISKYKGEFRRVK